MNLRERFADWLTGGALTREREKRLEYVEILVRCIAAVRYDAQSAENEEREKCKDWIDRCEAAHDALAQILSMDTPHANATARRMANVAREALEIPKLHG